MLNSDIAINKFELQSRNYVHFWTNAIKESHESPYPSSYGLKSTTNGWLVGFHDISAFVG